MYGLWSSHDRIYFHEYKYTRETKTLRNKVFENKRTRKNFFLKDVTPESHLCAIASGEVDERVVPFLFDALNTTAAQMRKDLSKLSLAGHGGQVADKQDSNLRKKVQFF